MAARQPRACVPAAMFVSMADTISSFEEIVDGKVDDIPESLFLLAGGIAEVHARYDEMQKNA